MDIASALAAVVVFLAGQFILKLTLEPGVRARETMGRAHATFDYYADVWSNPPARDVAPQQRQHEASEALRRTAGEMRTIPASVLGYELVRRGLRLPSNASLDAAARGFIGLSNNLYGRSSRAQDSAFRYSDTVKQALNWR